MEKIKKPNLMEVLLNRRMLICIFNGFTAGLPIYFLAQLIPAWLRSEEVDLKTIGFFSFVMVPYSFKYLWAPLLDRYVPPFLGRRRGWMMVTQVALLLSMVYCAFLKPKFDIDLILFAGLAIAFFSASQDIVLDAYRRELLPDEELGLGNSYYANAYRISGFIPGGLGLIMADYMPWHWVFIIISAFMFVGIIHTFAISELVSEDAAPKSLKEAVVEPFMEFFKRDGFKKGVLIIAFIFFYKFGDTVATALITPFYLDVGFTKTVLGSVIKSVSVTSMIIGGFIGGVIMFKAGINKSLWIFGFIQMASILGFAVLNESGPNTMVLGAVVAFEYLGVGLGSAALMAYIAANTNKSFTGTQLALLTSIFAIPKSFSGIMAGVIVEGIGPKDTWFYEIFGAMQGQGYTNFFFICTILAIPGMLLLFWIAPWNGKALKNS
ncbi:MAG: PAT family beta-lactamase induction signal transducer AmpG [Bacteriovoracaceae bacterium]|jgi:PAT family beta-lactamase induction signal transducer AmpG